MGHLAGAWACLEVDVRLDVGASQVDRLDVHNRDGLQDGLQGIRGLQADACLGNLGVVVHQGSPVVGHPA